jgi:glycosyltransferase involved in cell wall biosynthesis
MHIAFIEFAPSGGLYQFTFQLGAALAEQGHRVTIMTGSSPELRSSTPDLTIEEILPTWHPGAGGPSSRVLRKLRRLWRGLRYVDAWRRVWFRVRRDPPDVLFVSTWRFLLDGWVAARLAERPWRPTLALVAHEPRPLAYSGGTVMYKEGSRLQRTFAAAYRGLDVVFVLGEQARSTLLETWKGVRRAVVIPHGDEGIFRGEQVQGPDAAPQRILFFGTWNRYKGIDVLLEAFALVRKRLPDAGLTVAGGVTDDVDAGALQRRAIEIGGVDLRPGYVAMGDVPGHFAGSRVVVTPYRRASQSGVVHLAQTFGRPVVATAVGDIPEAVGEGGIIVPPEDPAALADALIELLVDPERAARLGRAGQHRLERESSWPEVAGRVADALQQVLAGSRG